jgi:predicted O-methyltransferase YrrM
MENWIPTNNDLSYYPLLHMAIKETKGDVLELGTGYGSTELLHNTLKKRRLFSYEEKKEWLNKFKHLETKNHKLTFVKDWDIVKQTHEDADVIFIDHAPGERRKVEILNYKNSKGILVCHDTELGQADAGYQMRQYFPLFKYVVEVKTKGAWATALSNEYDLTKWIGTKYGDFEIVSY